MNSLYDIVIPVGPNDLNRIIKSINYTKKNILGYRKIFMVSKINFKIDGTIFIDENIFNFNINQYIGNTNRNGWYLQQLIKLYSGFYIPDILNNYLVLDADTFFLKPTGFFNQGIPLYNTGTEYHLPYFHHMSKLHPQLYKVNNESGICHHMLFQKHVLQKLFNLVESYHGKPFYQAFLLCINPHDILGSGASEYEIYYSYLHIFHSNEFKIRKLKWTNCSQLIENEDYNYVSCHWYL
jgi:hypothetical protein